MFIGVVLMKEPLLDFQNQIAKKQFKQSLATVFLPFHLACTFR